MKYELNETHLSVINNALEARREYLVSRIANEGKYTAEWAAPELADVYKTLEAISN